ncbi:MAG TPA: hypothetical protein VGJ96_07950 [Gemmatimonadaceae bacterium]|jgi:hypothetical protein
MKLACRWDIVRGALQVSALVGVVLNLINQGQDFMDGRPLAVGHVALWAAGTE